MRYIDAPAHLRLKLYDGPDAKKRLATKDIMRPLLKAQMDDLQVQINAADDRTKVKLKRRWQAVMQEWHTVCRQHRSYLSVSGKVGA